MNRNFHKPIKVAIVYPFFAHYRGPIIESLMSDTDIDFHFIAGSDVNKPYSSLKLYDFKGSNKKKDVKNYWFFKHFLVQKGLLSVLKEGQFDAVIFLGDWKYLSIWRAILYLKRRKIPQLFWAHGLLNTKLNLNNAMKFVFYNFFGDGGFVYDNRAKRNFEQIGFSRDVDVIYNSLNYEAQNRHLKEAEILSDGRSLPLERYLLFTGRLIKERRLDILFDAVAILKTKGVSVNVYVVGSGPYLEDLKSATIEKNIVSQIHFLGACYDEGQLCQYFIKSICCVFPGPIGLTAIHSLTYGVPVLTNDDIDRHKPEIEAIINYKTGIFFKNGDAESLAEKIEYMMNLTISEKKQYKSNCLQMVENFYTPEKQREIISGRLKRLLK